MTRGFRAMKRGMMFLLAHITNIGALASSKFVRGCQTIRTNFVSLGNIYSFGYRHSEKCRAQSNWMIGLSIVDIFSGV